jgi:hypothetical protein
MEHAFFLRLILAWKGNLPLLASILCTKKAICDIWFSKVCVLVAKDYTISSKNIPTLDEYWG